MFLNVANVDAFRIYSNTIVIEAALLIFALYSDQHH